MGELHKGIGKYFLQFLNFMCNLDLFTVLGMLNGIQYMLSLL